MDGANRQPISRRQFLGIAQTVCTSFMLAGCARHETQTETPLEESDVQEFDQSFQSLGSARTMQEIIASRTIVVGVCSDARPYSYLDGGGNYVGLDVVSADVVAWDWGVSVRYVETDPADAESYLQSHKVDAVFCSTAVPGESCLQSTPFIAARQAIVAKEGVTLEALEDLSGMKVAVCKGTFAERFITDAGVSADVRSYDSYTLTYQALKNGAVDVLCVDQLIARVWVKNNKGYVVVLDDLGEPCPAGILVSGDNESLVTEMSHEAFRMVNEGRVFAAYDKYVAPSLNGVDYKSVLLTIEEDV